MKRAPWLSVLAGLALITTVGACVGDDPDAPSGPGAQPGADGGGSADRDADDTGNGEPKADAGDAGDARASEPEVSGRVVDHRGLPLAQAGVVLTDGDGKKATVTTGADGRFTAKVKAPYDAVVQRTGSVVRHVYLALSSSKPIFRTLGEFAVTDTAATASLTLTPALAAGSVARVVGVSDGASVGTIAFGAPANVTYQALPDTTSFPITLGVLTAPSAGGRPTAFGQVSVTATPSAASLFTANVPMTTIPSTGGGAVATTLVRPPGLKVAARALKLEFASKAIAIAQTSTSDDPATTFGDFSTLGVAGVKYAVEALAAQDSFTVAGRGRFVTRPLTFGRRGGRAENALNIAVELAAPPILTAPTAGGAGFPRKGPVAFAPSSATTFKQVHAVRLISKAAGSNGPSYVVYTTGPGAVALPDDGLAASTTYVAEVLAFGPHATLDAFVEAASPLPLELLEIAGVFAEAGRVRATEDGGDTSFSITSLTEFTTGP